MTETERARGPGGEGEAIAFPPLHEATLADDELHQLLDDIEQHAEVIEILVKGSPRGRTTETPVTLGDARRILDERAARGVQIRYRYHDAQWWDTLLILPAGVRLVRVRHDFPD
ncbi:MAG: hypothetical protein ACYTGG_13615 [Planctomycetota bacterium]|jgi:hypothetical protein